MSENINSNGHIFGGWVTSQIDMGGAILAKEISGEKVVTAQIKKIIFLKSIAVGDLFICYAHSTKIGKSSITIKIEVWIKTLRSKPSGKFYLAAEAIVIYVAVDSTGKPRELLPMSII
jgi:acyl-CoA thioesterase YciA